MALPENYKLVYSAEEIHQQVQRLGAEICSWAEKAEQEHGQQPLMVCILRGGIHFFSDLIRAVERSIEPAFCRTWAYSSDTNVHGQGAVRVAVGEVKAQGRAILMVDDICDTGSTLLKLQNVFLELGAKEVKSAVLIHRHVPESKYSPDWTAFSYEGREWFVGYGMEDKDHYSNLPAVYKIV